MKFSSYLYTPRNSRPALSIQQFLTEVRDNHEMFVVMDTETTGFSASEADVIEVSAIKVKANPPGSTKPFSIVDKLDMYVNPGYPLPERIVEFNQEAGTGICDEFLRDKPAAAEVAAELNRFFAKEPAVTEKSILVGHNIEDFDVPFLEKLLQQGNVLLPMGRTFDTLRHAKAVIPYMGKGTHKLVNLHPRTNGSYAKEADAKIAHTSIYDCMMTLDLVDHFAEPYPQKAPARKLHKVADIVRD